jgi:hypothetical protein
MTFQIAKSIINGLSYRPWRPTSPRGNSWSRATAPSLRSPSKSSPMSPSTAGRRLRFHHDRGAIRCTAKAAELILRD